MSLRSCCHQGVSTTLQVWTFKNRVAFVLSVTDKGQPVRDGIKLQRLKQLLRTMMDKQGNGVVNIKTVRCLASQYAMAQHDMNFHACSKSLFSRDSNQHVYAFDGTHQCCHTGTSKKSSSQHPLAGMLGTAAVSLQHSSNKQESSSHSDVQSCACLFFR